MTKYFIWILFLTLILEGCKTEVTKKAATNGRSEIFYDTTQTAIMSWHKNTIYPFDSATYKTATLTQEEFRDLDRLFNVCVQEYNGSLTEGNVEHKIDVEQNIYKKQLMVAVNSRGEKEVWVNCFCHDLSKSWQTDILIVDDGGPCYFNFKVNLTTKKIYDLRVNGFA